MPHECETVAAPAAALAGCLDDLASLLDTASDLDYVARPPGGVSGSVGAHVRHCVEHVLAIAAACAAGVLSYDHRRRDPRVEQSRATGIAALREAVQRLRSDTAAHPDQRLLVAAQLDREGRHVQVESSVGRELVFVLQHTIHHQAMIALLLTARGLPVPRLFGYAPSTPVS